MESVARDEQISADEVAALGPRVRITFYHTRTRLADPDGLSGKAAIDGIVEAGLLPDDSAQYVAEVRHFQIKGSREETRIVIEGIEEEGKG